MLSPGPRESDGVDELGRSSREFQPTLEDNMLEEEINILWGLDTDHAVALLHDGTVTVVRWDDIGVPF